MWNSVPWRPTHPGQARREFLLSTDKLESRSFPHIIVTPRYRVCAATQQNLALNCGRGIEPPTQTPEQKAAACSTNWGIEIRKTIRNLIEPIAHVMSDMGGRTTNHWAERVGTRITR